MVTPLTKFSDMEARKQLNHTLTLLKLLPKRSVCIESGIFLYDLFKDNPDEAEQHPFTLYAFDGYAYGESEQWYVYLEYPQLETLSAEDIAGMRQYRFGLEDGDAYTPKICDAMLYLGKPSFSVQKAGA